MFFNADDDDDFTPSFGAGSASKSNLSSLFGADHAAFNSSSNESLTYTAPKQPKKQAGQDDAPAVIHAAAAQAFKYVNGQYASQGKLGAAILADHAKKEYRLLVYASKKQQITTAKITSIFSFVVQANNYTSFYDDARQSWSLRFDTQQAVIDFAKQIGLTKYNSAPGSLVKQDLQPGDGQAIESGDMLEVKYTGSLWTNNKFGKVFDTNANADKLFKLRPGKGKVIKGWEEGVLGMKKAGKRLLVIPPELAYGDKGVPSRVPPKSTLLFEVEISRVKFAKEKQENVSNDTPPLSAVHENTQGDVNASISSGHSKEDEDVRDSTTSTNKDLSVSPDKGSEKAKLLARMSKMGKNVLKLPGAVAVDVDENETETVGSMDHAEEQTSASTHAPPTPERPRTQSREYHEPLAHSPGRPRVPPRSAHVNKMVHHGNPAPHHVPQAQAPPQYHNEYQTSQPMPQQMPPQQQSLALYQAPIQTTPPFYQQQSPHVFPQSQQPFQPVYHQTPQPVFQPAPALQPAPSVQPSSVGSGTSDVMMPMLMTESRQHQTEVRQAISKVSEKIDSLENKIEHLKKSNEETTVARKPALPGLTPETALEASVLMNSVVKLVQENERLKKENVEKTEKVEGLNEKISELLHRSQRYVEQSNIFLEQRNESLQQSSSYSQSKLVELEREKTMLSTELSSVKQNLTTMETELEILRKQDSESRELLQKTSSQLQRNKTELSTAKEVLTEREEEVEKLSSSLKLLKQERKVLESNHAGLEENVNDLKQEKESLEKNLAERRKKLSEVKKRADEEMEELKSTHEEELNSLKERHRRELTSSSSSLSQQISQLESETEEKWQEKSRQMVNQCEKRWKRKYDDILEENEALKNKWKESEDKHSSIKTSQNQHLQKIEDLEEKLRDMEDKKNKFESLKNVCNVQTRELDDLREKAKELENAQKNYQELRSKSIEMKEKYKQRIKELEQENEMAVKKIEKVSAEAKISASLQQNAPEPSREKLQNEVKQIMNKVFFKIREKFVASDTYSGSSVVAVVLNVIKSITLKMTSSGGGDSESDDDDEEDESEEEESESEEEEEQSGKDGEENENDDEPKEKKKNTHISAAGSGVVESDKIRKEAPLVEDGNEKEAAIAIEETNGGKNEIEEVSSDDNEEGASGEPVKKGTVEVTAEVVSGVTDGGTIEDHGDTVGIAKDSDLVIDSKVEDPLFANDESDDNDMDPVAMEVPPLEDRKDIDESTKSVDGDPKGIDEDTKSVDEDTKSVDEDTKSVDEDLKGIDEDPKGVDEDTKGVDEDAVVDEEHDRKEQSWINEADPLSDEDIENISNKPVLGSEHASISSGDLNEGNNGDSDGQDDDPKGSLVSDVPDVEDISGGNEGTADHGEDLNEEIEDSRKVEVEVEDTNKDKVTSEEKMEAPSEEKSETKNVESLSDFLSDEEDDVVGLFDAPPTLKSDSTPVKKEETPTAKAIPPPLFDDDDEDDLDWFS